MQWNQPQPPPRRSGLVTSLAAVGGLVVVVAMGIGIGFLVLSLSGRLSSPVPATQPEPLPTVTVSAPAPDATSTNEATPAPTVTVTPTAPWAPGVWSPGSPCLIPFPGLDIGLEYGYTDDATIKSWVYGAQELIQRLYDWGLTTTSPGPLDGEFGAKTEAGVLGFQSTYGIVQTGRLDASTWATLRNQCERLRS